MEIIRRRTSVADMRRLENMMVETERTRAHVDYIAMMNDIQLPTPESTESTEVTCDER